MIEDEYREVRRLLGAYLHQDWPDEFHTPAEAVEAFKASETESSVLAARAGLDSLLERIQQLKDPDRFLAEELYCFYSPSADGLSVGEWLLSVKDQLGPAERPESP